MFRLHAVTVWAGLSPPWRLRLRTLSGRRAGGELCFVRLGSISLAPMLEGVFPKQSFRCVDFSAVAPASRPARGQRCLLAPPSTPALRRPAAAPFSRHGRHAGFCVCGCGRSVSIRCGKPANSSLPAAFLHPAPGTPAACAGRPGPPRVARPTLVSAIFRPGPGGGQAVVLACALAAGVFSGSLGVGSPGSRGLVGRAGL